MIFSNTRKSPLKEDGIYETLINNIREFDNLDGSKSLVYYLTVYTTEGNVQMSTSFRVNDRKDSPFGAFKSKIIAVYGDNCNSNDHIGTVVKAQFKINKTPDGDEFANLLCYAPLDEDEVDYEEILDEDTGIFKDDHEVTEEEAAEDFNI